MPDTTLNTGKKYDIHNTTSDIPSIQDVNIAISHAALLADLGAHLLIPALEGVDQLVGR